MSDYFNNNNNQKFEWGRDKDNNPIIKVNHGDHNHTLKFDNSGTVQEIENKPNEILGNSHRNSDHK